MNTYEQGRIATWERTGLLDKCNTPEEKLCEALKWEDFAKRMIAAKWGH